MRGGYKYENIKKMDWAHFTYYSCYQVYSGLAGGIKKNSLIVLVNM